MLSNKTQAEKSETFLLAHALLLFVLSLLVGVQGVFEIIDYMPHISNVASEMECTGLIPVQPETEEETTALALHRETESESDGSEETAAEESAAASTEGMANGQ